jgi:4-alpha-glucanotransferase
VLQFGFDGHPDNSHLPDNYTANTVVYTGTHDNPPTREWYEELPDAQRQDRVPTRRGKTMAATLHRGRVANRGEI